MAVMTTVEDLGADIRAARRARRWSQARLATEAGVGRQWLNAVEQGHRGAEAGKVLAVLAALGLEARTSSAPADTGARRWLSSVDTARAVRRYVAEGDVGLALRVIGRFLDELEDRTPEEMAVALAGPPSTGDRRWDVLFAAAAARWCRKRAVPVPDWTAVSPLRTWWSPVFDPVLSARTMARTPVDFSVKGIWLDAKALEVR